MKLPNGFGPVYKLTDKRRKPYAVKVTTDGKQKAIGHAVTYEEGIELLVRHHNNSTLFTTTGITT